MKPWIATTILVLLGVTIVAPPILLYDAFGLDSRTIIVVWLAGAGALGLLSGYTTGASEQTGTAGEARQSARAQ